MASGPTLSADNLLHFADSPCHSAIHHPTCALPQIVSGHCFDHAWSYSGEEHQEHQEQPNQRVIYAWVYATLVAKEQSPSPPNSAARLCPNAQLAPKTKDHRKSLFPTQAQADWPR
eukprot:TRINITY_DN3885_c0_g1_i7.p1 TRINITY_DN3885_c0_g1~~TRINITY_DN3885_c0_g1_i7.p1  ORF type:complete len:116 (+),score=9.85 TRINITY_DN3885_c0_g1_i7:330-677(+)